MSAKKMGQVYDLDLAHPEQSVLLALADHADHEGRNAHPGIDLLVWKTGYSERQVIRILRSLEVAQLIIADGKVNGGRGRTTIYRVCPENGVKKAPFEPRRAPAKPRHKAPEKGDILTLFSDEPESPSEPEKGDILSTDLDTERVTFSTTKGDISSTERVTFEAEKGDIFDADIVGTRARNRQEPSGEPSAAATRAPARESPPLPAGENAAAAEDSLRLKPEEISGLETEANPLLHQALSEADAQQRELARLLRDHGVSREEAELLCAEAASGQSPFGLGDIRDQIEWLPHRNARKPGYWLPIYIRRGEAKPSALLEAQRQRAVAENRRFAPPGLPGCDSYEAQEITRTAFLDTLAQHERLAIFEEADGALMNQSAWREYARNRGKGTRSYQTVLAPEVGKIVAGRLSLMTSPQREEGGSSALPELSDQRQENFP